MEAIVMLAGYLIQQLPVILVWIVGVILALFYRKRHPKISLMALAAILIFFVNSAVGAFLSLYLPLTLRWRGLNPGQTSLVYTTIAAIQSLIGAGAWGLIIAAIFSGRSRQ